MIEVGRDEILRALKRFKGIAKQDLLATGSNSISEFWKTHAEARRETYTKLIDLVEESGIENACVFAFTEYLSLPATPGKEADPVVDGHFQALEMFFNVIGIRSDRLRSSKMEKTNLSQLLNSISQPRQDCYAQN